MKNKQDPPSTDVLPFCNCQGIYSWSELERNECWLCRKPIQNRDEILKDYKNGNFAKYQNS